jgi:hypothetical protein
MDTSHLPRSFCKKIFEARVTRPHQSDRLVSLSKPAVRAGIVIVGTESDLDKNEHYAIVARVRDQNIDEVKYIPTEGATRDVLFINDQNAVVAIDKSLYCMSVSSGASELQDIPRTYHRACIR